MRLSGVISPSIFSIAFDKMGCLELMSVSLKTSALPSIDEKLCEEDGSLKEKNEAMAVCRKYIGQTMWLTTRTRPDISACLGILASLIVRSQNKSRRI